jgi:hypothetical protein
MLTLLTVALAFNGPALPSRTHVARSSAMTMAGVGGQYAWFEPDSGKVWDPLGLGKEKEKFDRLRYVEVKHGRIAMLAVLGHITAAAGVRLPGEISKGVAFADIKGSGFSALSQVPTAGLIQMFLFVGLLETWVCKDIPGTGNEFPGDLRNGQVDAWDTFSPMDKARKRMIEINNGRAAMMGILALMIHEGIDGKPYIINEMLGMGQPY